MFSSFKPSSSSAAAAAVEQQQSIVRAPTLAERASLSAVPSGMVAREPRRTKRQKAVSMVYDRAGVRPGLKALAEEQSIRTMVSLDASFILTPGNVTNAYFAAYFAIGQYNLGSFLAVFDQYRIDLVEVWLSPVEGADTRFPGTFATCLDYDDANVPTTSAQVMHHPSALVSAGNACHYHRFVPHMAVAAYSGAFTSYANVPAGFIDSASPNVQHFGIKGMCSAATSSASVSYAMYSRLTVTFRAPGVN